MRLASKVFGILSLVAAALAAAAPPAWAAPAAAKPSIADTRPAPAGLQLAPPLSPHASGGYYQWTGVSCASSSYCVTVGNYQATAGGIPLLVVETFTGNRWSQAVVTGPSWATSVQMAGVSCAAAGDCVAVGRGFSAGDAEVPMAVVLQGSHWQFVELPGNVTGGAAVEQISCASSRWCLAVGQRGNFNDEFVETDTAGHWTASSPIPGQASSILSVSCPAAGSCAIVNQDNVGWLTGSTWHLQQGWQSALVGLGSISCTTTANCTLVGTSLTPKVAVLAGGRWSSVRVPTPPGLSGDFSLQGISCTEPSLCLAAGTYAKSGTKGFSRFFETEVRGVWSFSSEPEPSGLASSFVDGLSCASLTLCAMFGTGTDAHGNQYAWYEAEVNWHEEGFWTAASNGAVYPVGAARELGWIPTGTDDPVVGLAGTVDGGGYWEVTRDGTVAAFGDARSYSDLPAEGVAANDIVAIAPTTDGRGYWLIGADGGEFAFGDARYHGSLPGLGIRVDDVVGMVAAPGGGGYLLVGADGGVFAFGATHFFGSLPALGVKVSDVVGILPSPAGTGYALVGSDGGVFNFGSGARYYGSLPAEGVQVNDVVGLALTLDARGYWLAGANGTIYAFGDAEQPLGSVRYTPVAAIADAD